MLRKLALPALWALVLVACNGVQPATPAAEPQVVVAEPATPLPEVAGVITYTLDGRVFRLVAQEGAEPEDISLALDALSPGFGDNSINVSPDGGWLVLDSNRFDPECGDWSCLALVSADLTSGEAIRAGGELVHANDAGAVASGGGMIVYPGGDGPHEVDLWAITRSGSGWSAPLLLTGDSPHAYNELPAISADGGRVLFDCGAIPYGNEGTSICEVGSDGAGFRVVLTPTDGPAGAENAGNLRSGDYGPDGSIVFEADWFGEQVWRLPAGATGPLLITDEFNNDNSPCVLPDGRIASLWLDRPGGEGEHELKVMSADGGSFFLAVSDDVVDGLLGCGG